MLERFPLRTRVSLGFLALSGLALVGAMASYAGGSWLHPHATSHLFFENFWCDLLRDPAHNGQANGRSVWLATLGFSALAAALLPFWLEISALLPARRGAFVRWAGSLSALGTAAVALVPSDRFPNVHAPAVLVAGGLGFACGCLGAAWALAQRREVPLFAATSLVLVSAAAVNLTLYVRVAYCHGTDTIVLPAAQKLATLALMAWVVAGLRAARSSASRPGGAALNASRPKP